MAITHFIPEVWSAKLMTGFHEKAIFAQLANHEYEGEVKTGNTVHIAGVVPVQIHDYKTGRLKDETGNFIPRTTTPDDITDTGVDLVIDQEKNFDFKVDDVDKAQAAGKLTPYTDSGAQGLVEDADKYLAELLVLEGNQATVGAAATDGDSAWNILRDLRKTLSKQSVPIGNRVLVVNAEMAGLLLGADSKFTKASEIGTNQALREAALGRTLGFDVYESENLPETDKPQAVGWYRPTLAFASQINKTEAMRDQNSFADRVRGLHVYGGKVTRPLAVAHWTAA